MAEEVFIERPTEVYRAYLSQRKHMRPGFKEGQMAMALEIITVRKSLSAVGMLSAGMVSTLESLLADQGLIDTAESLYEELNDWRKLKVKRTGTTPSSGDEAPSRGRSARLGSPTLPRRDRGKDPSP